VAVSRLLKKQPANSKIGCFAKMAFLKNGHFVRIFGLSSKIRQLKKSTDGLFQQPVRERMREKGCI
jgi:hypothetical protein